MPLEIRHNRAEHTHENEQFRRVATSLRVLFEQNSWDGLLIGNPFNESFGRFRADAILLYTHGLVVIDFKDYSGTIDLPEKEGSFKSSKWYTENAIDKERIEIKAGAWFINPFRQLQAYRGEMYEIIEQNIYLKGVINPSRVLALNIFSGPIEIKNRIPGGVPYYKITQESDLPTLLYDFSSENKYCSDSLKAFNSIFKAEIWQEHIDVPVPKQKEVRHVEIADDVEEEVVRFLKQDSSGVLVLESMHTNTRDSWMRFILSEATEYSVPQTEAWCHSKRIASRVERRLGVSLQGLYGSIYGGTNAKTPDADELQENAEENSGNQVQEVISIKSNNSLDPSAVIILHEAHLVTRSLHQSEILKFGTGRLLEDLLSFLQLEATKRKLICIGDPYSLTYGKASESALNVETLCELYDGKVLNYREPVSESPSHGKIKLRKDLAKQIDFNIFNKLCYPWTDMDLVDVNKEEIGQLLKEWFSTPCHSEPQYAALTYTNKNAKDINSWIKKECIKTGENLSNGDLLILNNNINIPDDTGYGQPTKLFNGMYLLVEEVKASVTESIAPKNRNPVNLNFVELSVRCLSLPNKIQANLWILDNFFSSEDGLSREEQIAYRVFVNIALSKLNKKKPFENSYCEKTFLQSAECQKTKKEIEELERQLELGEKVKTKLEEVKRSLRKIEASYKRQHKQSLFSELMQTDSLVNAAYVSFGWALTVHKAVGSSFDRTILNAYSGDSRGINNLDYYRWLYSAVTTTDNVLYVANPRTIHPLMNCKFVDESKVVFTSASDNTTRLIFHDYAVEDRFNAKLPAKLNSNVVGVICEFSKMIEIYGFTLDAVYPNSEYQTKAHFKNISNVNAALILAIVNKGDKNDWAVTSLKIEKAVEVDKELVNEKIDKLFSGTGTGTGRNEFPDDFRGDVYRDWERCFEEDGISLFLINLAHNWQDVFEVKDMNSFARFRVWYDGKGFINKVVVYEKSNDKFIEKISSLVTKWNQSTS